MKDLDLEMHNGKKSVLLLAMPFAGSSIPSIQLPILEGYLKEHNINIGTRHLYLKATEIYGLINYNFLINRPNDSYSAQMIFSKYIFPEHWEKTEDKFKEYFNNQISKNREIQKNFSFEDYVQLTDQFFNWVLENVGWRSYDIIGFTLNYGQLLPSLAFAKKIKEMDPGKKIIFGGSRIVDTLGKKVLEAFDYIDFIVSGDGEEALYLLASDFDNYESIPRLMYRVGEEVIWNSSDIIVDINSLPVLDFDPFYEELGSTSEEVKQFFYLYGRLPIEISRGCWWNKCSFCNLNVQHKKYREKNVDKIIEEIQFLSDKYQMLDFQMICNTLPQKDFRVLLEGIKNLGRDFNFFVEARAGVLKSEDYKLLKNAGFVTIQTGIETFSQNYLDKMNKGVRIIDNIASLKFCKENEIVNIYNLIVNYPNEEKIDFKETESTIRFLKQYLDPPQISQLLVGFGSTIFNNSENFNIERLEYTNIDRIMFPRNFLEKGFNFFYNFKRRKELGVNNWERLVKDWKKEREKLEVDGIKRKTAIDKLVFCYVDGKNFLRIYDKRDIDDIGIYILDELERAVFLSCIDVISFEKLAKLLSYIPDYKLAAILHTFEQNGIVFREGNDYLSLPLRYGKTSGEVLDEKSELLLYSSGSQRSL